MPKPTYPTVIDTPGKLIDPGIGASMHCPVALNRQLIGVC